MQRSFNADESGITAKDEIEKVLQGMLESSRPTHTI